MSNETQPNNSQYSSSPLSPEDPDGTLYSREVLRRDNENREMLGIALGCGIPLSIICSAAGYAAYQIITGHLSK
jgi:hypothetical protein